MSDYWDRDIVERLRSRAEYAKQEKTGTADGDAVHLNQAADEIERLRAEVSAYAGTNTNLRNDLVQCGMARDHFADMVEGAAASAKFVKWALQEGTWEGCDLDGYDIQKKATELGLIVRVPYDPEKHGESEYDIEPGDDWYVLADNIYALSSTESTIEGVK